MRQKLLFLSMTSIIGMLMVTTLNAADWQSLIQKADSVLNQSSLKPDSSQSKQTLSNGKISAGLKEALEIGVSKAINILGAKDGFLADKAVQIVMPDKLKKMTSLLRKVGQGKRVDEFEKSMNRAAEKAVPQVANVFTDAIKGMTLNDGQKILQGNETAATDYFKGKTSKRLGKLINPMVKESMEKADVTRYYNGLFSLVKKYDPLGLSNSYLSSEQEINEYVTSKTMDGLFVKIADQEKQIRANPVARTTDLLKEVFSAVR